MMVGMTALLLGGLICLQTIFVGYYLLAFLNCKISKGLFFFISFFSILITKISVTNNSGEIIDLRLFFFVVLFILVYVFFSNNFYKKLYHYLFLSCLYLIQNQFLLILSQSHITESQFINFIIVYVLTALLSFAFVLALKRLSRKHSFLLDRKEYLILSIFPLFSILILCFSWKINPVEQFLLGTSLLIFNAVNFYLYNYLGQKNDLIQQQEFIQMQNDFQAEFLKEQKEIQILRHDLKNMLLNIEAHARNRNFQEIQRLTNQIQQETSMTYENFSGCFVIDSILNNKVNIMKRENIAYVLNSMIPSDLDLQEKELDICAILGNLLDNAIEEIKRNQGKGEMDIILRYKDDKLIFQILNTTLNDDLQLSDDNILSSKRKGRLGIGIPSIRERVNKLHGYVEFTADNAIFKVMVVIPFEA